MASMTCAQATPSPNIYTLLYSVCICMFIHQSSQCRPMFIIFEFIRYYTITGRRIGKLLIDDREVIGDNLWVSQFSFGLGVSLLSGRLDPFVLSVLLDPVDDSISISSSIVLKRLEGLVLAVELESGEALDISAGDFVLSGVDLDEEDVGVAGESPGSLVEVGSQVLAVAAPGSVELHQHLLVRVQNDVLEALSDDHLHGLVVLLGNGGGFVEGLQLSSDDLAHEVGQSLSSDLTLELVLLTAILKQQHGGGLLSVHTHVLGQSVEEPMSVILGGEGEDDFGGGLIKGPESIECIGFGTLVSDEEEEGALLLLEDGVDGGVIEGDDLGLEEGQECHEDDQLEGGHLTNHKWTMITWRFISYIPERQNQLTRHKLGYLWGQINMGEKCLAGQAELDTVLHLYILSCLSLYY